MIYESDGGLRLAASPLPFPIEISNITDGKRVSGNIPLMMGPAAVAPLETPEDPEEALLTSPNSSTATAATATATATTTSIMASPVTPPPPPPFTTTAWLTQLPMNQMTMTMYIPTPCVGALIGRKGSTIAQIQKQAQTNPHGPPVRVSVCSSEKHSLQSQSSDLKGGGIHATPMSTAMITTTTTTSTATTQDAAPVSLETDGSTTDPTSLISPALGPVPSTFTPLDFSDPQWTPVVIRADPLGVWKVATQMEQLLQISSPLSSSSSFSVLQDSILDLPLGRQKHALLVGKRGINLQHVSSLSSCRIHVPPKEKKLDMIQLEGSLQQMQACLELLVTNGGTPATTTTIATTTTTATPSTTAPPMPQFHSQYHRSSSTSPLLSSSSSSLNHNPNVIATNATSTATATATPHNMGQTCQATLTVTHLPSQTKLRSVGRKTDTIIKKKKIFYSGINISGAGAGAGVSGTNDASSCRWILTILGPTSSQVQAAHAILTKWAEGNMASPSNSGANDSGVADAPKTGTTGDDTTSPISSSKTSMTTTGSTGKTTATGTASPRQQNSRQLGSRGRGSGRGGNANRSGGNGNRGGGRGTTTNGTGSPNGGRARESR